MAKELSLINFIDRANEALFFQETFPADIQKDLAGVMALQGKPGAYAEMFALPQCDQSREFRTFTGEPVKSNAARRHIIGEETIRLLSLAGKTHPEVIPVCRRAIVHMTERIHQADEAAGTFTGIYCCGLCSAAFWRNLAAGNFDHGKQRLEHGLRELKNCRLGNGRWRRFPFFTPCWPSANSKPMSPTKKSTTRSKQSRNRRSRRKRIPYGTPDARNS